MSTVKATFVLSVGVFVFVFASSILNPTPEIVKQARVQHSLERMALLQTIGDIAIVGGTAILLLAGTIGIVFLWRRSTQPLTVYSRDGLFPVTIYDRSTPLDRLTGQRRILAHDPNRSGGATLSIHADRDGQITAHGAQVESQDQAAIVRAALGVQKVQAGYRRGPTVAEIKGELGYYDRTPRPAIITEEQKALPAPVQPLLTLGDAIRQVGAAGDIPLGQQQDGDHKLAVWRPSTAPHMSILGSTQQGKSSSVGATIALCAIRQGWRVVILDPEEEQQWRVFAPWAEWCAVDGENITDKVLAVYAEYERRGELMVAHNAGNFAEIPPNVRPPRLLVVIEEYGDLRTKADDEGTLDAFDSAMARFAKRGAKRGVHMLLLDQHFAAHDDIPAWPDSTMRNMHRLSFMQPVNDSRLVGYSAMASLQRGEFARNGERYTAWHARPEVDRLLMSVPRIKPPFVLDNAPVIDGSFVRSVSENVSPTPENGEIRRILPPNESVTERKPLIGDEARQAIHAHMTANPSATQAEIRDKLGTSKGWTHQCWHEWHNIQRSA